MNWSCVVAQLAGPPGQLVVCLGFSWRLHRGRLGRGGPSLITEFSGRSMTWWRVGGPMTQSPSERWHPHLRQRSGPRGIVSSGSSRRDPRSTRETPPLWRGSLLALRALGAGRLGADGGSLDGGPTSCGSPVTRRSGLSLRGRPHQRRGSFLLE